jgi:mycoredoxin
MSDDPEIIIYGNTWCGGSRRARLLFDQHHIPYRFVDIDRDEEAALYVETLTRGFRSVPTIVWPDGSFLIEPGLDILSKKLNLE